MKKFVTANLMNGDILCGRNETSLEGPLIRAIVRSESNHNATFIKHNTRGWGIGDMFPPEATFVSLGKYERMMEHEGYGVRVLRIKDATPGERNLMGALWQLDLDGTPYNERSVKRLWIMRFIRSLPWKIQGKWCTRLYGDLCREVFPPERNIFRKIHVEGMPLKKNETPRTIENRLVQGLLIDVTDECIMEI